MSLKSLIQRLLDSRTTPAEAIHADRINLYTESTFSADTFTAPRDGFVRVWAKVRDGIAGTALGLNVSTNGGEQGISRFAFTGPSADNSIVHTWPIQKGETIRIEGFNLDIQLRTFFDAIGGGYNRFVRRALSCLRPSFNCLPRSFCKAKSLGLQNNQLLLSIRALIFLVQAPLISLPTPLRATAGRLLGAIQLQSQLLKSKSRTGRWHLLPYLTETLRELESVVTLKKGHRLSSCAVGEVQPIILFGSTKQVQTFNPLKGGALC